MSLLQRSRFDTFSGMAFLFQVLKAVPQWRNAGLCSKLHESGQRRLAAMGYSIVDGDDRITMRFQLPTQ